MIGLGGRLVVPWPGQDFRESCGMVPCGTATPNKVEVGTYLGLLLRPPRAGIPTVAAALLSQQEAAEAVARGVAVAYARVLA